MTPHPRRRQSEIMAAAKYVTILLRLIYFMVRYTCSCSAGRLAMTSTVPPQSWRNLQNVSVYKSLPNINPPPHSQKLLYTLAECWVTPSDGFEKPKTSIFALSNLHYETL